MTGRRRRLWMMAVVAAAAISAADAFGWWGWRRDLRTAVEAPAVLAAELAAAEGSWCGALVERRRRLPLGLLAEVDRSLLVEAMKGLGELLSRWLPAHPSGAAAHARSALLAGDLTAAEDLLRAAQLRDPTAPGLLRLRALVSLARGDAADALQQLAVAEAIAPGLKAPPVELDRDQAATVRRRALELRAEFYPRRRTENAIALARLLRVEAGDDRGARALLEPLVGHPLVRLELAAWALEDDRTELALEHATAVAEDPVSPRALRARAWAVAAVAHDIRGEGEDALEAAQQALRADPTAPDPYLALATLAERRGDLATALGHLRRAWGVAPTDTALLLRIAAVADRAGRPNDAIAALERAVEVAPGNPALAARLASLQLREGRLAEAALVLSRALDRHPTEPSLLGLSEQLRRRVDGR